MKQKYEKDAREIIDILNTQDYFCACPCCGKPLKLKKANLFFSNSWPSLEVQTIYRNLLKSLRERSRDLREQRKGISERSERGSVSSNFGKTVEKLVPVLRKFRSKFHVNDWRPLFDPIDFIIFDGLSSGKGINKIIFTEVKTNEGVLSKHQKQIRHVIKTEKKVEWLTY